MAVNRLDKKKIKNLFALGLLTSNILFVSGCGEVSCDVPDNHAHLYVTSNDLGMYMVSEKESVLSSYGQLSRTDEYAVVTDEQAKMLKILNQEGLFRIDENRDVIKNITASQHDYIEYEYSYLETKTMYTGENQLYYYNETEYDWTIDPDGHNLTGDTRECHYVYYGCKLIKEEKTNAFGKKTIKYVVVQSEPVDDISMLPAEYEYIKKDFYDIVDAKDHNKIYHSCYSGDPFTEKLSEYEGNTK